MGRFQHILVPLDFTPKNREAIAVVLELAAPGETRVTLLHVVESISGSEDNPLQGFYQSLEENAKRRLAKYAEQLSEVGIEVSIQVCVGKPARKIVEASSVQGASLIVLNSHPLGDADNTGRWATISYQVSVFCRCAVLLVK